MLYSRASQSNAALSMVGLTQSGISTFAKPDATFLPSRASIALFRPSSRELLSSTSSGQGIPIISFDSRRVETDDLRLWWDFGLLFEGAGPSEDPAPVKVEDDFAEDTEDDELMELKLEFEGLVTVEGKEKLEDIG